MNNLAPLALCGTLMVAALQAQGPATFDAASIKVNRSGEGRSSMGVRGSQLAVINYNLFNIIRNAWGLQGNQIAGGPDWSRADDVRFDITAKLPDGVKESEVGPMLQRLLADRFKLRTHRETRQVPVYAMVLARADGRLGPKMTPAAVDCAALRAAFQRGERPPEPAPVGDRPACGMRTTPGRVLAGGYAMADIGRNLSGLVGGRPVIDRTGLGGLYDLELTWTPDQPTGGANADTSGVSVFTALQEQLGLKLEATIGPVDLLVIDSAERPSED